MERITTIITTYNHKDFIGEAIESALGQVGHFVHTILIADDASTDGTREIVRQYAQKYPSVIRDISPDVNLGISGNMRRAFGMVEDDYVAILEGDDYWTDTGKLEKQLQFLKQRDDCSMVFSRIRIRNGNECRLLHRHNGLPDRLGVDILCNYHDSCNLICNFSCCLFKTKLLRSLPDVAYEGRLSEVVVALFMVKFGWVGYLGECLGDYRFHSSNVFQSAGRQSQLEQAEQTFLTASKIADEPVVPTLLRKADAARRELSLLRVNSGKGLAISIVTICRNNLEGLRRTAASVLAQTTDRFEWIVIDGGSTDGSAEYIKAELAPHVSYWCSEPDGGIYEALNKGVAHARGEYVIAMNSGDAFADPDVLRNCLTHEFKADVVYGDWIRRYPDHEEKRQAPRQLKPFHFIRLDLPNICHQAMFVRTSLLKDSPYDVRYRVLADYAKWRQFMLEGRPFQYVPLTVCRFQTGGLSGAKTLAVERDIARLKAWNAECGSGEVMRFVQKKELNYGKLIRGALKQFVPYGCMVWWMKRHYGECIDMPLLYFPGLGKCLRRVVKFALPCCLTCLLKRLNAGRGCALQG